VRLIEPETPESALARNKKRQKRSRAGETVFFGVEIVV